jgi:hypothetical protein
VESTASNLLFESEVRAIVVNQRDISEGRAAEAASQQDAEKVAR